MELVFEILLDILFVRAIRQGLQHVGASVRYLFMIKRRPYSILLRQKGNATIGFITLVTLFLLCLLFTM